MIRCVVLVGVLWSVTLAGDGTADEIDNAWAQQLKQAGIGADQESVARYLQEMRIKDDIEHRVAQLVIQLDADEFRVREAAQKQLTSLAHAARPALEKAVAEGSVEVKYRARAVLKQSASRHASETLIAAIGTLSVQRSKDALPLLIGVLPHCTQPDVQWVARKVLREIATSDDMGELKRALDDRNPMTRSLVIDAYANVLTAKRASELYPYLEDTDPRVRLATSRALANFGNRKCLSTLVGLLTESDLEVRNRAASTLRAATGNRFGIVNGIAAERLREAIAAWQAWLADAGKKAQLRFPLEEELSDSRPTIIHFLETRAGIFRRSGNWKKSAADYCERARLEPDNARYCNNAAVMLAWAGATEDYGKLCRQLLHRFGNTSDTGIAHGIAIACLIAKTNDETVAQAAELAQFAVENGSVNRRLSGQTDLAIAAIRLGDADSAVKSCRTARAYRNYERSSVYVRSRNHLVLSMAYKLMHEDRKSREELVRASELLDQHTPTERAWGSWMCCELLRREAQALILGVASEHAENEQGTPLESRQKNREATDK